MATEQSGSRLKAFLSQPFSSWQSTLLYAGLCALVLSIMVFLATKYRAIIRRQRSQPNLWGLLTSQHLYPRTPYPRSPLIQVTSASDDDSSSDGFYAGDGGVNKTRVDREPIFRWPIKIGSVERGHIAKRRRLSRSWTDPHAKSAESELLPISKLD